METNFIIAFIAIISVLYIGLQHLFNWALRKIAKQDLIIPFGIWLWFFYLIVTGIYWYYLITAFKLIL